MSPNPELAAPRSTVSISPRSRMRPLAGGSLPESEMEGDYPDLSLRDAQAMRELKAAGQAA
jgi:hypothetical protein